MAKHMETKNNLQLNEEQEQKASLAKPSNAADENWLDGTLQTFRQFNQIEETRKKTNEEL